MSKSAKRSYRGANIRPPSAYKPTERLTPRLVEAMGEMILDYHRLFHSCFQRREQYYWSRFYLCGQLSNLERKTIEPMVLALLGDDPNQVRGLQQFIGAGTWPANKIVHRVQDLVAETLGDPDGVVIVDGSGFPKQGIHSAGVARQYCGALGKVANCQEGTFLIYATPQGHAYLDGRLYLPEEWFEAEARNRWAQCGIPDEISFQTEPELALAMLQDLVKRAVVPFRWVTADEYFGRNPAFLDGVAALDKWYLAEIPCNTRIWLRTPQVELPPRHRHTAKPPRLRVVLTTPRAQEVQTVATRLPAHRWTRYVIKEGSKGPMVAEFAFLRVTTVRDRLPGPRVWLVLRRGLAEDSGLKFYLSNAPTACAPRILAQLSGWRWPVETTLEEGKSEIGLDQYEVRSWDGWYHHMAQSFMTHLALVRLQHHFKKNASPDDCPSPPLGRQCVARR
ncbi:MAG: IS701 family transposase [Anaerolineae bacterium]